MSLQTLTDYYKKRAREYEKMYSRSGSIRKMEQVEIAEKIKEVFADKNVLEIACGTGYWTQFVSETAKSITATDYVQEVIDIAKTKKYKCPVAFAREDAYDLSFKDNTFSGGLANLWISHITKDNLKQFLKGFHRVLQKGTVVFFADNIYAPGVGGKLITKPDDENTYKIRSLSDGSLNEVLKNYFTEKELRKLFNQYAKKNSLNVFYGKCFWYVTYVKK
jgi:ubiquinone/menaquinone biosynthesis C-methylase UbiE